EELFAHRRLWRRRGFRHRHLCRADRHPRDRRPPHGPSADRAGADTRRDDLAAARPVPGPHRAGDLSPMSEPIRRIAMWSGPRNLSTAMMRSFSSRPDCAVSDEPFYAAYLAATGIVHPMNAE